MYGAPDPPDGVPVMPESSEYELRKAEAVAAVVAMLEASEREGRDPNLVMGEFIGAFQQAAEAAVRAAEAAA